VSEVGAEAEVKMDQAEVAKVAGNEVGLVLKVILVRLRADIWKLSVKIQPRN
jgi:hypothetical protein